MTFSEAVKKLNGRESRKVGNNTYLERIDFDTVGVRLHRAHVVTITRSGEYVLNSNGWRTTTTKSRMNDFCPARVSQKRGEWFVEYGGKTIPYFDGIAVGNTLTLLAR